MSQSTVCSEKISDRLLSALSGFERIVVVTHDNPDPDAIASGWAIKTLIDEKLGIPVRVVGGGAIVRAENRHMVELLEPPIELLDTIEMPETAAAVLVDCGLNNSHQMLTRESILPVAVIDHHETDGAGAELLVFRDVRDEIAASATITASYLRQQGIEPGVKLATALLYAIRTEAHGTASHHTQLDRSIVSWLSDHFDPELLAEIENAPLSRSYYSDLALAMQSTFLYDDAALCFLPRAEGAEIIGEVADLLIRCRGIGRVLCAAAIGGDLLVSVRTDREGGNATELVQRTLAGIGRGGGHFHRAGGKAEHAVCDDTISGSLEDDLRSRWLAACGVDRQRGTRLVARREIVENL